jgi:acyl-CoA hydrolase
MLVHVLVKDTDNNVYYALHLYITFTFLGILFPSGERRERKKERERERESESERERERERARESETERSVLYNDAVSC